MKSTTSIHNMINLCSKQIEIRGEGGVYENEPERRDDVIHYDDEASNDLDHNSAKWASSAKERFMKDAEDRTKAIRSQVGTRCV